MRVIIQKSELNYNIRRKSHTELAQLPSEQRYLLEAGSDKEDEINRCIVEAYAILQENLSRFLSLSPSVEDASTDDASIADVLVLDFEYSGRRLAGREQSLADECLAYLTDATLSNFYLSVGSDEMAKKHAEMATNKLQFIMRMLYTKLPPRSIPPIV